VGRRLRVVELGVRRFELAQDAVAQMDRVGEILEADRVLRQARHRERPGHGPRCEHQLLVGDLERIRVRRLDRHDASFLVQADRGAEQELRVRAHLPQRHDDVPRLDRA
jgi:hypothetical protein